MRDQPHAPWVKPALEYGPILAFFAGYFLLKDMRFPIGGTSYDGIIVVTAAFVPLMVVCTLLTWRLTGELSRMQVLTLVLVVVFGGLTVWLNDERFIKMKPTILYLLFAAVLGAGLSQGRSYLRALMGTVLPLTDEGWMTLTKRLTLFFLLLALANELVWRFLSTETWVTVKTFGLPAALFAFFMAQAGLIDRHSTDKPDK
jgi:intracellular septation protein